MEYSFGNSVGVADGSGCRLLGAILSFLHPCLLLSRAYSRMMVLLEFLEEVESVDYDLLAIERDSERIGAESHFLDTALMSTDEA